MRNFNLHGPLTGETWPEQRAIRAYEAFHRWKASRVDRTTPGGGQLPLLTRRLDFVDHIPVSRGVYILRCGSTLRRVDEIQDMLMQMGFTLRGMGRRHARGESVDDGKVGYLKGHFWAWVGYLTKLWRCMTTAGMLGFSFLVVSEAAGLLQVAEEVAAFVRDMDFAGVVFLSEEWDEEAREWTEAMLREEDWLAEGAWRERFCDILRGRDTL